MAGELREEFANDTHIVVIVPRTPAPWQALVVQRLRALGEAGDGRLTLHVQEAPAGLPEGQAPLVRGTDAVPVAIIDLTGTLDPGWCHYAGEGLWRLCDDRGLPPDDPDHGRERLATGAGIQLHLVAWTAAGTLLVDTARAFAEPRDHVTPERVGTLGAALLVSALCELGELGALRGRHAWRRRGGRPAVWQRLAWRCLGNLRHGWLQLRGFLLIEQWMIGVVDMPFARALRAGRLPVRWLGARNASHCWADPFGVPGRHDEIYCEEVDLRSGLGRIVALKLDARGAPQATQPVDLGLPGHLSFPYLFRHEGALYCVAESSQSRRCVLCRQDDAGRWQQVAVLLENTAAVDPTVFWHQGRFWLAYTDVALGQFDNLCLCHATDLLGPWHPHPQNPVKFDHGSARSAGTVVADGEALLRVAQVCRTGYGQAVAVNRVVHCTPSFYREDVVGLVSPAGDPHNPHGLHTMSDWDGRVVVDGKRYVFDPRLLWHRVRARLGRATRTPAPAPGQTSAR